MNIFFLATEPEEAARHHWDKHVVKMILETAQILKAASGASAWQNHPCSRWAKASLANYRWLARLGIALLKEYELRYGKVHAYTGLMRQLQLNEPDLPDIGLTGPPIVTTPDCVQGSIVESYRMYYNLHKAHFARWRTEVPYWFKERDR